MKKGIVVLLVVVALIIIVSPGILGRLAEKSVDENLNWAANESGELVVSSQKFDRGWFSSEGQHRIELRDGALRDMLAAVSGQPDSNELPVLVIDTHLDHGLIPLSSMGREKGSLAPGLGNSVSTLSVEFEDGSRFDVPGAIYSKAGLTGALQSTYILEAGSREDGGSKASWGPTEIEITTNPSSGAVDFDGEIGALSVGDGLSSLSVDGLRFSGIQEPSKFGFATGDIKLELDEMTVLSNGVAAGGLKAVSVDATTDVSKGRLNAKTVIALESKEIPQFGEVEVIADIRLDGADAEAVGALQRAVEAAGNNPDPGRLFAATENDLKRLFAAGLAMHVDRFDITLPSGAVAANLDLEIGENDAASFEWTSLLLSTEAAANVSIPESLLEMAMQMNPNAGAMLGMGFLQKNGDVYEVSAEYKKGLLTINGAPMPIPFGSL